MKDAHKLIAAYAVKFDGDWERIYTALCSKEYIDEDEVDKLASTIKSKYITILDPRYPPYLKHFYHPPFILFYYGDISLLTHTHLSKRLAVIGTRNPTEYGIKMTKEAVNELAKDYIIVSGMASGIDAISHWSAINNRGKTIAVLGSGIDYVYPSENILLYNELKKSQLVMSEYPNSVTPTRDKFPHRNRLVAYFSAAVVITEALDKSGTSITAGLAINIGRDVFCYPDLATKNSCCNRLIKEGATMVESPEEIKYELKKANRFFE